MVVDNEQPWIKGHLDLWYLSISYCLKKVGDIQIIEPVHETSNNVVCATSKASDQPAHKRSLIRAFDSRSSIL